jgi:hypothetical protein
VSAGRGLGERPGPDPAAQQVGVSPGHSIYDLPQASLDRLFQEFANMGMRWVRVDLNWSRVEPAPGGLTWTEPDRIIRSALDHGLAVLPILGYSPAWAASKAGTHQIDPTSIAGFARAAATRYGPLGVSSWEIWNEANLVPNWQPAPDPTGYGQLLAAASAAIKSVQPGATVLVSGLSATARSEPGGNISAWQFLRQLYDGGFADSFDGVSVHPYTYPGLAATKPNAFTELTRLRKLMVSRGDAAKSLWITETGAPTGSARGAVSQRQQARIIVDAIQQARRYDWIRLVLVYGGIDSGTDASDREQNFGFLHSDFTAKRAYWSLMALLKGPTGSGQLSRGRHDGRPSLTRPRVLTQQVLKHRRSTR